MVDSKDCNTVDIHNRMAVENKSVGMVADSSSCFELLVLPVDSVVAERGPALVERLRLQFQRRTDK